MNPTIAAIATGPAAGGIGVIRISGPNALPALRRVAPSLPAEIRPRHAYFTHFTADDGTTLDEGLALFFAGPASFTGEDVAELQLHGAPRLLSLLLTRVLKEPGVTLAQPGEFTQRAFLNGRMDLARAEAVADLIAADSEASVRAASAQLSGGLSVRVRAIREPLLALFADLQAALDFPEEAEGAEEGADRRLAAFAEELHALLKAGARGTLVRRGARVVLFGPVNAGKSTLFNHLVGAEKALVDPEPGTTRDALEVRAEHGGLSITWVDTAGLRDQPGRLEARGIERTRAELQGADLTVLVVPPEATPGELSEWLAASPQPPLLAWSKSDLSQNPARADLPALAQLHVSGLTGAGVSALVARVIATLGGGMAEAAQVTSARHLDAIARAASAIERAQSALTLSTLEVVAGEAGMAVAALGEVTGEDASTELIDTIFRKFCLGK